VPWGISGRAFNLTDRHGNYQYRAFGVPGLGLKRGLATTWGGPLMRPRLAAMVAPREAVANFRRLGARGPRGRYGYTSPSLHAAQDVRRRQRGGPAGARGVVVKPSWPTTRA